MAFVNKMWLTIEETCQRLGIDKKQLHELANSGELPLYEVWKDTPYNSESELKVRVTDFQTYVYNKHLKESTN